MAEPRSSAADLTVGSSAGNSNGGKWIAGTARAGGGSRNFKLWAPSTAQTSSERAWPLLVLLHGCTHNAKNMAQISGMNEVAEKNQFLVVYPEQSRLANLMKCWNWFHPKHQMRDAGEPSILAAIVDQVSSTHNVDPDRIYVAGISAGGAMAAIMAANYPDIFAALAVFAGTEFKAAASASEGFAAMKNGGPDPNRQGALAFEAMRPGLARKNRRRMPVIVFHGTADTRVNPVNADQSIAQWAKTNECLALQQPATGFNLTEKIIDSQLPGGHTYQKHTYVEADGGVLMEKWVVQGLGHAWSGSPQPSRYGDPQGPHASAEIWRFFNQAAERAK